VILGIYHINVNVTDLDRSRAFYEMLGFKVLEEFREVGNAKLDRGLALPRTDTRAYFLRIGSDRHSALIDLVQWQEPELVPTFPRLNQLGPARIALRVKQLDRMYEDLRAKGVEFLSAPQTLDHLPLKPRFVVFRDPDGILLELVEF
jgi:catechol 2,3-dioxygenase-like lactoylglutathione lyase family enzyme